MTLPDLFAGEDLVDLRSVSGELGGIAKGRLTIDGTTRRPQVERFGTEAVFPRHEAANDFIPRLWASRKVGELSRLVRHPRS